MVQRETRWTPERIRKLREWKGWTQGQLASELGYKTYQTVLDFENGKRKPPLAVQKVLDMMAVGAGDLFERNGKN